MDRVTPAAERRCIGDGARSSRDGGGVSQGPGGGRPSAHVAVPAGGGTPAMSPILKEVAGIFEGWHGDQPGEAAFNDLAMRIHAAQRETNAVLRRFWDGASNGSPSSWHEIPPVPAAAFRDIPIVSGTPEVVFRTSGTTGGDPRRGEHHILSLDLYRAATRANYRRHLLHSARRVQVLALIPGPDAVPDSSLSNMAGFIAAEPEVSSAAWAFHPEDGVDIRAVRDAAASRNPVLVLTTAFALVHLLDALGSERIPLPEGSRMMETGGFKGRVAEVDRATLYRRAESALGIPERRIVNEYGMTELLSQAYDGVAGTAPPLPARVHRFPPWVRTRALDPATLAPLPPGEPGLLAHFDMANAGSVCHILTEDLGHTTADGGLHLHGRATGATPRGCSLAAESFLRATGLAP
ncbi:MAG: hypothetical protein F4X60_08965 [Gemmatimonadetes bacterium]|nr:hypothetical protein [Gemmatimonadota bacterium]